MQAVDDISSRGMRILPRDGGGGTLSTSTIVIIAVVCGCVLLLVLSLFLWRLLVRFFKPKTSAPLPPKQDLAHHREQQLAAFSASRPTTAWLGDTFSLGGRGDSLGPTSSNISLLTGTPERKASYYMDDVATAESTSELPSPLSNEDLVLAAPNPTFVLPDSAHTSLTSMTSSSSGISPVADPSSTIPPSDTASSHSYVTAGGSHLFVSRGSNPPSPTPARRSQSNPRSLSHPRSRPVSTSSFSGTTHSVFTQRSGSVLRGVPHAPYSGVQIVLPTPLAPQVHPYMQPLVEGSTTSLRLENFPDSGRSSTFVDQWIHIGSSQSYDQSRQESSSQRQESAGKLSKHTASASESFRSSTAARQDYHRRSTSQPRFTSERKPSSLSISSVPDSQDPLPYQPPPVPRIPSVYGTVHQTQPASSPVSSAPPEERGRPRTSRSDSKP